MDVLPFALELAPTPIIREGKPWGSKAKIVCCGCGQQLGERSLWMPNHPGSVTLYPGYRLNGAGVYVRKRPPRGPYDTWETETGKGVDYVFHLYVESHVTIICHRHECRKRQIVRGNPI